MISDRDFLAVIANFLEDIGRLPTRRLRLRHALRRNIEKLGFSLSDIKIILMTEFHADHHGAVRYFKERLTAAQPGHPRRRSSEQRTSPTARERDRPKLLAKQKAGLQEPFRFLPVFSGELVSDTVLAGSAAPSLSWIQMRFQRYILLTCQVLSPTRE